MGRLSLAYYNAYMTTNRVGGAAGKWLLFEPFLSLLKFLLPQSSEQADSCKHKAPAPVWGEGGEVHRGAEM